MLVNKQEYKLRIIEVFKQFIKICEEHQLKYFCHGGTAIGIIRHEGMIPWDDDIDVLMPRPDYNKFIEVFKRESPSEYDIMIPGETPFYYLPFVKMCDKNSTLLEFGHIPSIIGAFIDVFPLDGASSIASERAKNWLKFRHSANKLMILPKSTLSNLWWFFKRVRRFEIRTAYFELECAFNKKVKYQKINDELYSLMTSNDYETSEYVGSYGSQFGPNAFWPKEWFGDYVMKNFEGFEVKVPRDYDKILTTTYGDYMKLPPEEKQITNHFVAFIDMSRRLSVEEVYHQINK